MIDPREALDRLLTGNQRFVAGQGTAYLGFRSDLANGQTPFAVLFGCSDSRVPAEIVFDVGLGDLFVIRVAGNVVAPSQIGSIEFAVSQFDTRLVVVMGHTRCGAVGATLQVLDGVKSQTRNLASITNRISPNIREVAADHVSDPTERLRAAIVANVHASVEALKHGSELLEELVTSGHVHIVGALYAVETGEVTLL